MSTPLNHPAWQGDGTAMSNATLLPPLTTKKFLSFKAALLLRGQVLCAAQSHLHLHRPLSSSPGRGSPFPTAYCRGCATPASSDAARARGERSERLAISKLIWGFL